MCCEWSESNDYHKFITQDTCVNFPISRLNRCEKNLDLDRVCCSIKKKGIWDQTETANKQDITSRSDSLLSSCQGQIVFVVIWVQLTIFKIKTYKDC